MSQDALAARVAALEAELATLRGTSAAADYWAAQPVSSGAEPRTQMRVLELVGNGLPKCPREVRRLIEAVAVCKGAASPAQHVPVAWEAPIRRTYEGLERGLSWAEALRGAGLTPPDADDLSAHVVALRRELGAVCDRLPGLFAWLQKVATSSHVYSDLKSLTARLLG